MRLFLLAVAVIILVSCNQRLSNAVVVESTELRMKPVATKPRSARILGDNIGFVSAIDNRLCLMTPGDGFKRGENVVIFASIWYPPITVLEATIKNDASSLCSDNWNFYQHEGKSEYYELELRTPSEGTIYDEIAIVTSRDRVVLTRNGTVRADVDHDGNFETFRWCTGNESLYYTAWKGRPLSGNKIWDAAKYLNYDTEPTCTKKDYD
jgi:hypothetical protein